MFYFVIFHHDNVISILDSKLKALKLQYFLVLVLKFYSGNIVFVTINYTKHS